MIFLPRIDAEFCWRHFLASIEMIICIFSFVCWCGELEWSIFEWWISLYDFILYPTLSIMYSWFAFAGILLKFASIFERNWSVILFSCNAFLCFFCQDTPGLIKWIRYCSLIKYSLFKRIRKWITVFFNILGEFV